MVQLSVSQPFGHHIKQQTLIPMHFLGLAEASQKYGSY